MIASYCMASLRSELSKTTAANEINLIFFLLLIKKELYLLLSKARVLKTTVFILFERQRETGAERERCSIGCFPSQMPTSAGAEPVPNQEPGTQLGSPTWVARTQVLEPLSATSHGARWQEAGIRSTAGTLKHSHSNREAHLPSGISAAESNTCPWNHCFVYLLVVSIWKMAFEMPFKNII